MSGFYLASEYWDVHDGYAWLFDTESNYLFRADFMKKSVSAISSIPIERKYRYRTFSYIYEWNDEVYIFPDRASYVYIYNQTSRTWNTISLEHTKDNRVRVIWCKTINSYLYFFSANMKCIMRINGETKKIDSRHYYLEDENKIVDGDREVVTIDHFIYVHEYNKNKLYKINFTELSEEIEYLPIIKTIKLITYYNNSIWIYGDGRELYSFNVEKKDVKHVASVNCNGEVAMLDNKEYEYSAMVGVNNGILFISALQNSVIMYNINDNSTSEIKLPPEKRNIKNTEVLINPITVNYVRNDRYVGIYLIKYRKYYEIDALELKVEEIKYEFEDINKYFKDSGGLCYENETLNICSFIHNL